MSPELLWVGSSQSPGRVTCGSEWQLPHSRQPGAAGPASWKQSLAGSMCRPEAPPCMCKVAAWTPSDKSLGWSSCIATGSGGSSPQHGHCYPASQSWSPIENPDLFSNLIWHSLLTGKFGPFTSIFIAISLKIFLLFYFVFSICPAILMLFLSLPFCLLIAFFKVT